MKPLTETPEDVERFRLIAYGRVGSRLVWAGIGLGLSACLSTEPRQTGVELARRVGAGQQPMDILLYGLAALGVLVKEGDRYSCAPLAQKFLDPASPDSFVGILGWQHHIVYRGLF